MDAIRTILIEPHYGLYDLGSGRYGSPLPFYLWPSFVLSLSSFYLLVVLAILPGYMKNRKAYDLRKFMLVYNVLQMICNLYIGGSILINMLKQGDIFVSGCLASTPALVNLNIMWMLNKYSDMIETGIFVLRHKSNQVSFLHVYHHVGVVYYAYLGFVDSPGGYATFCMMENSFIHAIMYGYYFTSIYDKRLVQTFQNFKQRITQIQMIQFALNFYYFGRPVFGMCSYTRFLAIAGCIQSLVLLSLFGNFYYNAYIKTAKVGKLDRSGKRVSKTG